MFRMNIARITKLFKQENNIQYADETIPVFDRRFGTWLISVQRLELSSSELTRLYDEAAPRWCRILDQLGYPGAYERLLRKLQGEEALEIVGARPRVLDCGVGTGALSCALARTLPEPFNLDAIDLSPRMLERARQCFRDTDLDVALRHGDIRDLPYEDGVFDIVMAAHVLEHLADPCVALNEMVRVLKPGGLLIACLTRRSALGMFVHLKWRTHGVTPIRAESWLRESGLVNTQCLSLDERALCQRMSMACIGRKPFMSNGVVIIQH